MASGLIVSDMPYRITDQPTWVERVLYFRFASDGAGVIESIPTSANVVVITPRPDDSVAKKWWHDTGVSLAAKRIRPLVISFTGPMARRYEDLLDEEFAEEEVDDFEVSGQSEFEEFKSSREFVNTTSAEHDQVGDSEVEESLFGLLDRDFRNNRTFEFDVVIIDLHRRRES